MPKIKYRNNTGNKSVKGGTLVPFHKEGNTTYFKVFANDPLKTDSVLVGPNNKNGIALDNNEIVKETKNHIEVASDDLGTVNVIENLSNRMPLPDAFRQGFIRQELYKNNKFVDGGETSIVNNKNYNENKADLYYDYLRNNGLNHEQTAGVLGNMAVESYLNANIKQKNGPAYGLMQWEGIRKNKVKNYKGNPYLFGSKLSAEEQKQLDYIINSTIGEYDSDEWKATGEEFSGNTASRDSQKAFKNTKNVKEATILLLDNYERPKVPVKEKRLNMANYYDKKYKDNLRNTLEKYNTILKGDLDIDIKDNKDKGQSNQPSLFTGGRIRMVDGGDKKGSGLDLSKFTKRIDKNGKPYLIYDNNIFGRIYNVEHLKTTNLPKINQVDFDSIPVSNTSDGFGFIANTNNTNNDYTTDIKRNYYSTSKYSDRPNKTNNDNMSNKQQKIYIDRSVSRYSDKPIKSNDSSIKEDEFVGPVLNGNGFIEPAIVTAEQVTKPVSSSIKQKNKLRKIDNNLLTSDYNPTDIAPNKEIEDITLDNTFAKQVADQTLGGYEYLSPIDVLNPIKRQVQSPVKKGVYSIGKSGPSFIDKVRLGWDKFKSSMTPARAALLGSTAADVAGNIINAGIERNAIDSTRYVDAPIQHQASKLLTNYNINPQLDSIANSAANAQRNIEENTLSSKVAQNRLNMLGLNTSLNNNQLYAQKENTETQLINQDTMNQQSIRNSNIDSYNQWLAGKTEFDNNKILSKANATASAINGIGQTLGNLATGLLQEQQFNNNVELLKAMNPDAAKVVPAKCGGRYNKKRRK